VFHRFSIEFPLLSAVEFLPLWEEITHMTDLPFCHSLVFLEKNNTFFMVSGFEKSPQARKSSMVSSFLFWYFSFLSFQIGNKIKLIGNKFFGSFVGLLSEVSRS
jgi:hypothetical protein